jgi:hypothetical protein
MFSVYIGGVVMSMMVIVPQWSESPPESVRQYFGDGRQYRAALNFVGPRWMLVRNLPLLALLVAAWPMKIHRGLLIVSVMCSVTAIVFTLTYIYPINEIVMVQAGIGHSPEEVRALVRRWIAADRIRLIFTGTQFLCLLIALSIPFRAQADDRLSKPSHM